MHSVAGHVYKFNASHDGSGAPHDNSIPLERGTEFLHIARLPEKVRPPARRIADWNDTHITLSPEEAKLAASRCFQCGIPYCHTGSDSDANIKLGPIGCPIQNEMPDSHDHVTHGRWHMAAINLHNTNPFGDITGRICPAPCEQSCTFKLHDAPVNIRAIERAIADKAYAEGWDKPFIPSTKTGKTISIIGSGPAGLQAALFLAEAGHEVHIYEKSAEPGGLLKYGIPDFKLPKDVVQRHISKMGQQGIKFHCGEEIDSQRLTELIGSSHAVALTIGAETPRDIHVPGRELEGVHFAMPYLIAANARNRTTDQDAIRAIETGPLWATNQNVLVLGGGDTGSDCVGTALRQDAKAVMQITRGSQPQTIDSHWGWPHPIRHFEPSDSHIEAGIEPGFGVGIKRFIGENGKVVAVDCVRIDARHRPFQGTDFIVPADKVLLALGFEKPRSSELVKNLGVRLTAHGNVQAKNFQTSVPKLFTAGDCHRGPSLVVWALREGRDMARSIDASLKLG